ncbi:MAG TPA: aspartate aminotransferase family protein [Firmicutes bacterium]|nr:aspartate aminotransferase family protein [Bacillota bacterium]
MLQEEERKYIINTYNRQKGATPLLVRGQGSRVWDENGKEYLDFVGGIAVNALGHCYPPILEAVSRQMEKIIHTSNLYYSEPQVELARMLVENSPAGKVFFANSGAEANEAAIKLARKYTKQRFGRERYEIVTALDSFHGRTLATITATGQEKFHRGFEPLVPGFRYARFNDLNSFRAQINSYTCAIMVEPVQGEGGIHVATPEFLQGLRRLCDEHNLLLIFDEIQCGMGRTGKLFAFEHYHVVPDIFTLAKALGGGLPIGAMLCTEEVAGGFSPGDHASTFGGNPVACAAATAAVGTLLNEGFLELVRQNSAFLLGELERLQGIFPGLIKEIRGKGFMLGLEIGSEAVEIRMHCQDRGLLINCIGGEVLRLLPPLNTKKDELVAALGILEGVLQDWVGKNA